MHSDDLREWLIGRVAHYLSAAPETIRADVPLADYGLDSVYALVICGDIEDHYQIVVEPTLAWDHPTIDALAAHLGKEIA